MITHPANKEAYYAPQQKDSSFILSKSMLWQFMPDPQEWRNAPSKKRTAAMDFGDLVDCLALTPEEFPNQFVISPATYPCTPTKKDLRTEKPWNKNATYCQEWEAERGDRNIITAAAYAEASEAVSRFAEKTRTLMDGALTQVEVRTALPHSIHQSAKSYTPQAKCLIDIVPATNMRALADLKTTADLTPHGIERTIYKYGYHVQAAMYLDLYNLATGENRDTFYLIFVKSSAPYTTAIRPLSPSALAEGRRWYYAAVRQWTRCINTGVWPSPWDDTETPFDLPNYATLTEIDNDED